MTKIKKASASNRAVYARVTLDAYTALCKIAEQESQTAYMRVTVSDILRKALREYIERRKRSRS